MDHETLLIMEFLGEIRNDEIFISKDSCSAQCPAGPPGRPGRTGPQGPAGNPGLKGSKGDPGISTTAASVTETPVHTTSLMTYPMFTTMRSLRKEFIPRYSPVGSFRCRKSFYYFATSFFTRSEKLARDACKRYDCDIIIEWTQRGASQIPGWVITGWDIGNLGQKSEKCPHNPDMTATVIWKAT